MKRIRRMTAALLSVLAVFLLLPLQALAAGSIDLNRDVSLTISYQDGNTPLVGAEFDIFLVATVDEYGELTTSSMSISGARMTRLGGHWHPPWRAMYCGMIFPPQTAQRPMIRDWLPFPPMESA